MRSPSSSHHPRSPSQESHSFLWTALLSPLIKLSFPTSTLRHSFRVSQHSLSAFLKYTVRERTKQTSPVSIPALPPPTVLRLPVTSGLWPPGPTTVLSPSFQKHLVHFTTSLAKRQTKQNWTDKRLIKSAATQPSIVTKLQLLKLWTIAQD